VCKHGAGSPGLLHSLQTGSSHTEAMHKVQECNKYKKFRRLILSLLTTHELHLVTSQLECYMQKSSCRYEMQSYSYIMGTSLHGGYGTRRSIHLAIFNMDPNLPHQLNTMELMKFHLWRANCTACSRFSPEDFVPNPIIFISHGTQYSMLAMCACTFSGCMVYPCYTSAHSMQCYTAD